MKKSVWLIVIAMALDLGVSQGVVASETKKPAEIPWVSSFDTALTLAKKQDKPILLDFYNPK
jgi:hypothetical protein